MMSNLRADALFRALLTVLTVCVLLQGCSPSAPELTPELSAALQARAFAAACEDLDCQGGPVYSWDTTPEDVRSAIAEILDEEVAYLDSDTLMGLTDDRGLFKDGGTSIATSRVQLLKADVIGVDTWRGRGLFDGRVETVLFRWDGADWMATTSDEVGVTVTSSVP